MNLSLFVEYKSSLDSAIDSAATRRRTVEQKSGLSFYNYCSLSRRNTSRMPARAQALKLRVSSVLSLCVSEERLGVGRNHEHSRPSLTQRVGKMHPSLTQRVVKSSPTRSVSEGLFRPPLYTPRDDWLMTWKCNQNTMIHPSPRRNYQ